MTGLVFAAVMSVPMLSTGAEPYSKAYHAALDQSKPMVVLVGTDWCPACVTMKQSIMPEAERQGVFKDASFTVVDADRDPQLAQQMMRGGSIPQVIVYTPTAEGWVREGAVGAQPIERLRQMVENGRERIARLREARREARAEARGSE